MDIPFNDFGGTGIQTIHFAHANGYSAEAYRQLLVPLTQSYKVIGIKARPLWSNAKPQELKSWNQIANDLISFLEQQKLKNIIGCGHSMGATTTILAANKRPDLFSKLILVEPVILDPWIYMVINGFPDFMLNKIIPHAKSALNRKDEWKSTEDAFSYFRTKNLLKNIPDNVLWDYVNSALKKYNNNFILSYSKLWEAHIYRTMTNPWKAIKKLDLPLLIIKGESTDVLTTKTWKKLGGLPTANLISVKNSGHLLPFEKSNDLSLIFKNYLNK